MKKIAGVVILVLFFAGKACSDTEGTPIGPPIARGDIMSLTLDYLEQKNSKEQAINQAMLGVEKKIKPADTHNEAEDTLFSGILSRSHPYINIQSSFADNLLTTRPRKSSMINEVISGIRMNLKKDNFSLKLDPFIDDTYYSKFSKYNFQSAGVHSLATLAMGKYIFTFADDYFDNFDITRMFIPNNFDSDNPGDYRWRNTIRAVLGTSYNRVGYTLEFNSVNYQYLFFSPQYANSRLENSYSFNPYLNISKKNRLLFGYTYMTEGYNVNSSSSNYFSNTYNLSLASTLTGKITSLLKGIYTESYYKTPSYARDAAGVLDVGYKISQRSDADFYFKNLLHRESAPSGTNYENDFLLTINHRLAFNPKFRLSFSQEGDYKVYPKRISAPNPQRDTNYNTKFSLSYAFRQWMDFKVEWNGLRFMSNVSNKYVSNQVTLTTDGRF